MTRRENGIDCDEHVDARVRFSRLFISLSVDAVIHSGPAENCGYIATFSLSTLLRSASGG